MNDNATILEELKVLSAHKDLLVNAYDEKKAIEAESKSQLNSHIEAYLEKKDDFLGEKSSILSDKMPAKSALYNKEIPDCKAKSISAFSAIVGIVFYAALALTLLSFFVIKFSAGFSFILVFALLISGFIWLFKNGNIDDYFTWEKEMKQWRNNADKDAVSKEDLVNTYLEFEKEFTKSAKEYSNFESIEKTKLEETLEEIKAPFNSRLNELEEIINENYDFVQNSSVLHSDYIAFVDDIILYLESGRADNLKEALNLAIEEDRKVQNENARREEALRQEQILEEQARQAMLHNQEMERMEKQRAQDAKIHAAQMEAQAKIQAQETRKLREELEKQNKQRRY